MPSTHQHLVGKSTIHLWSVVMPPYRGVVRHERVISVNEAEPDARRILESPRIRVLRCAVNRRQVSTDRLAVLNSLLQRPRGIHLDNEAVYANTG